MSAESTAFVRKQIGPLIALIVQVSIYDVGGLDEDELSPGVPRGVFNSRHHVAGRGRQHLRSIVEDGIMRNEAY